MQILILAGKKSWQRKIRNLNFYKNKKSFVLQFLDGTAMDGASKQRGSLKQNANSKFVPLSNVLLFQTRLNEK